MSIRWDYDPLASVQTGYHVDDLSGDLTITHREDVEAVLRANREDAKTRHADRSAGRDLYQIASIPVGVAYQIRVEHGIDVMKEADLPKLIELLHDPEYAYLKTAGGDFRKRPTRNYYRGSTSLAGSSPVAATIGRSRLKAQGKL